MLYVTTLNLNLELSFFNVFCKKYNLVDASDWNFRTVFFKAILCKVLHFSVTVGRISALFPPLLI